VPSNATFYIADPSMLGSRMLDKLVQLGYVSTYRSLENPGGQAHGLVIDGPWGSVRISFVSGEPLATHLGGLSAYAQRSSPDPDTQVYLLARIAHVRMALGCVFEHSPEKDADVLAFVGELNGSLNSLLFIADSIFDWDGTPLCGPEADGGMPGG
jgi:hypothetical protein